MKWIQSPDNPLIKEIKKIKQNPEQTVFLEGIHLIQEALKCNIVELIVVTENFIENEHDFFIQIQTKKINTIGISEKIAKHIADTVTPQGIFALAKFSYKTFNDLEKKKALVIIDRVQDPGNLGTIIRASEAFGADGIILTPGTVNALSAKVLRASTGSIFFIPVVKAHTEEISSFIENNKLSFIVTDPSADKIIQEVDFTEPFAVAFGNEAKGVSVDLRRIPHLSCRIPHSGKTESLNVAMAATVVLYEAFRQRECRKQA